MYYAGGMYIEANRVHVGSGKGTRALNLLFIYKNHIPYTRFTNKNTTHNRTGVHLDQVPISSRASAFSDGSFSS